MYYDDDNVYIFISEGNLSSTAVAVTSAMLCYVLFVCLFVKYYIYQIYGIIFFFQSNEKQIEGIKKETQQHEQNTQRKTTKRSKSKSNEY